MSKIAFLAPPAHGHVNPTLPIVKELVRRGEQVVYYNHLAFRQQVEAAGARFVDYPATEMTASRIAALQENGNLASVSAMLLRTTETLLPFMLAELRSEQPDLIVFDSLAVWGKMAAQVLNLKAVASITHFVMEESQMTWRDKLFMIRQVLPSVPAIIWARRRLIRRFGREAFPTSGPLFPLRAGLNLVYTARELHPPSTLLDGSFRFVGPSIDPQARGPVPSLEVEKDRMLVYISLGTVNTRRSDFYRLCFEAFSPVPARFLLSVGRDTPLDRLGTIPPNFTVRDFVPQLEALQGAGVFITHAGMNSLHEALYYGVPMVLVPRQFEQLVNARLVADQGAGILIRRSKPGQRVTAGELRQALEIVSSDRRYRQAAGRLQRILHATGGYRSAADEIQACLQTSLPLQ